MTTETATATPAVDFAAIKGRQQAAWSTGNYAVVGTTLQIVGENLAEAMDLRSGMRVLDVAAGNGNATLAAARRWCDVTSTDYVPALLESGRARAMAEGHAIKFQEADAENLPFANASFDAVMSTFGVMFTPNQERAAAELMRVCRPGGKIGLANWTPESFIGQLFKIIGRYIPPVAGIKSPSLWGTESRLAELFGPGASAIRTTPARIRVPLSLARALDRGVPHLLRPDEPDVRRAGRRAPGRLHPGHHGPDGEPQSLGRPHARAAERIPRGCRRTQGLNGIGALASDGPQIEFVPVTQPDRAVPMVAQFVIRIGMGEYVECSVVQREPAHDIGELRRRERDLEAPLRMRANLALMESAHLNSFAELRGDDFAEFRRVVAIGGIEVDMRVPARGP